MVFSAALLFLGPSSQLNRSVESRMKWISSARRKRKVNRATSVRRGSKSNQTLCIRSSSADHRDKGVGRIADALERGVALRSGKPRAPQPHEDVGDHGNRREDEEARQEDRVELLGFRFRQPGQAARSFCCNGSTGHRSDLRVLAALLAKRDGFSRDAWVVTAR